tara:strand:+ start:995 stop:2287 length:1293 start_codon:yes stop_codon:yes gene_type:complete
MAVKFSEFVTATTTNTNTRLVGFDGVAGSQANKQLSLSLTGIYSTDGILSANRTVTMNSNDLTFVGGSLNLIPIQSGTAFEIKNNPSSGTAVSMLKVKESGLFYIGKGAVATSAGDVVIGELASVTASTPVAPGIAIGKNAFVETTDAVAIGTGAKSKSPNQISIGSSAGATQATVAANAGNIYIGNGADTKTLKADNSKVVCIGQSAQVGGVNSTVIGYEAGAIGTAGGVTYIGEGSGSVLNNALATNSVAIGRSSKVGGAGAISIGYFSQSSVDNSITLNASGASATNAIIKSFKVFMTDGTTPDFDVVAGGESTLNTSLKITGQAYTELNAQATSNLTFNWNDGNIQSTTGLTGSPTFTATNPKAGATYIITLTQTGPVTATWTGIKWPGGTAPTLSGASKTDVITLICYDATGAGLYYGAATLDLS